MKIQNLNQLKREIQIGQTVKVENFLKHTSDEKTVIGKQTNGVWLGIEVTENEMKNSEFKTYYTEFQKKYYKKIFLGYQKAKDMNFKENTVNFLAFKKKEYMSTITNPSNDFEVGQAWLEMTL